jgi:hypothetical protein
MLTGGPFDRLGVPPAFCEINQSIISVANDKSSEKPTAEQDTVSSLRAAIGRNTLSSTATTTQAQRERRTGGKAGEGLVLVIVTFEKRPSTGGALWTALMQFGPI